MFIAFASGVKATSGMFLTCTVEKHMQKLKLRLDDLQVDTFQTIPVKKEKGTVFGEQCTCRTQCTCPGCYTCDASCNGTCDASCNGTCGGATCDVSCYGSCDYSCDCASNATCDYTCSGYVTAPDYNHECIMC